MQFSACKSVVVGLPGPTHSTVCIMHIVVVLDVVKKKNYRPYMVSGKGATGNDKAKL